MAPQGFADLMDTMRPELIDAMPLGMGGMMRGLGKTPGALSLMKPMFPVLFPRLLPLNQLASGYGQETITNDKGFRRNDRWFFKET